MSPNQSLRYNQTRKQHDKQINIDQQSTMYDQQSPLEASFATVASVAAKAGQAAEMNSTTSTSFNTSATIAEEMWSIIQQTPFGAYEQSLSEVVIDKFLKTIDWYELLAQVALQPLLKLRFLFYLVWPTETMFSALDRVPRYVAEVSIGLVEIRFYATAVDSRSLACSLPKRLKIKQLSLTSACTLTNGLFEFSLDYFLIHRRSL